MDSIFAHLGAAKQIIATAGGGTGAEGSGGSGTGGSGESGSNGSDGAATGNGTGPGEGHPTNINETTPAPDRPIEDYTWDGGESLLNFDEQGAGTQQLSNGMEGVNDFLIANDGNLDVPVTITPELQGHLQDVADARGITLETAEQDFQRLAFLIGEGQDIQIGESNRGYGNLAQLRFGHVVGEALDVDPAFASLLSPNGGLTGPGGISANIDGDGLFEEVAQTVAGANGINVSNEALAYHSPTHDGLGFLQSHFNGVGPGYCYTEGECLFGEDSPYSGQFSGIDYWEGVTDRSSGEVAREGLSEVGGEAVEAVTEVDRENAEAQREIREEVSEAGSEIIGDLANGDVNGAIGELGEGIVEVGGEVIEGELEQGREAVEGIVETGGEAVEGILDFGNDLLFGD